MYSMWPGNQCQTSMNKIVIWHTSKDCSSCSKEQNSRTWPSRRKNYGTVTSTKDVISKHPWLFLPCKCFIPFPYFPVAITLSICCCLHLIHKKWIDIMGCFRFYTCKRSIWIRARRISSWEGLLWWANASRGSISSCVCFKEREGRKKTKQHRFIILKSIMYSFRDEEKRKRMRKSEEERELNRQKHFIRTPASVTNV